MESKRTEPDRTGSTTEAERMPGERDEAQGAEPGSTAPQGAEEGPTVPPMERLGPCTFVIFGAGGDLTKRKLFPALYNLAEARLLPEEFAVLGMAKTETSDEDFREMLTREVPHHVTGDFESSRWEWFRQRLHYVPGNFTDPAAYTRLREALQKVEEDHGTGGNTLFYLATPPSLFGEIVRHLGEIGLLREEDDRWRRVIIEKPFGRDLDSARGLNSEISQILAERQIFRIDHYLGKETVQNILVFRFSNGIFEPIWNRRYVDHVQITVAEELGVENRASYYEEAGALRDMIPNHLFQLLDLIAMEPPVSFEADAVRNEKGKILRAVQPLTPEEVLSRTVRGQYGPGKVPDIGRVPGYREEPRVARDSGVETFVALKLHIDNWRWAGVPFYLRTGKRLASRVTEITIQFKRAPYSLFRTTPVDQLEANRLILRIQPEEGISLRFGAKLPGQVMRIGGVEMDFRYEERFGRDRTTGYETLLYDCMSGDATLFQRGDNVEEAWRVVTPILDVWKALPPRDFPNYPAGGWGPAEADALIGRDNRQWRTDR